MTITNFVPERDSDIQAYDLGKDIRIMNKTKLYQELEKLNAGEEIEFLTWEEMNKLAEEANYNSFVIKFDNVSTWSIQLTSAYLDNH